MILADFVIDDTMQKAIWAAVIAAVGGLAYWARVGWLSLIGFIKPKIEKAFDSHTNLVDTMADQLPVVSATLSKLGETQQQQCSTLEQHSKILELHGGKLDKLLSGGNHEGQQ